MTWWNFGILDEKGLELKKIFYKVASLFDTNKKAPFFFFE
jgi:hypothetical protein